MQAPEPVPELSLKDKVALLKDKFLKYFEVNESKPQTDLGKITDFESRTLDQASSYQKALQEKEIELVDELDRVRAMLSRVTGVVDVYKPLPRGFFAE